LRLHKPPPELLLLRVGNGEHELSGAANHVCATLEVGELKGVDAGVVRKGDLDRVPLNYFLLLLLELVELHMPVSTRAGDKVGVLDEGGGEDGRGVQVVALQRENGPLLVHDPQVETAVGLRRSHEVMIVHHVDRVREVVVALVQQL